jgi:hypothetical protein
MGAELNFMRDSSKSNYENTGKIALPRRVGPCGASKRK